MTDDSPQPLPSLPRRVLAVFISPGALFERLRDQPAWAGAVGVAAVVTMATGVLTLLLPMETVQQQMREVMGEAGLESSAFATGFWIAGIALAGAVSFVYAWVVSGVMYFVFAKLLSGSGSYRQYLAVASHAVIVRAGIGVLLLPVQLLVGDLEWGPSLGSLAPGLEDGYLLGVLEHLDLLRVWTIALLGLGISKIHLGRSWAGAFLILLGVSVIFSLGLEGLRAMLEGLQSATP